MKNLIVLVIMLTFLGTSVFADDISGKLSILQSQLKTRVSEYQDILESGSSEAYEKVDQVQNEINKLKNNIEKIKKSSGYETIVDKLPQDKKEKLEQILGTLDKKIDQADKGILSYLKDKLKDKISAGKGEFSGIEDLLRQENYEEVIKQCDAIILDGNGELKIADTSSDMKKVTQAYSYKILALLKLDREEEANNLISELIGEKNNRELIEIQTVLKDTPYNEDLQQLIAQTAGTDKFLDAKQNKYGKRNSFLNFVNPFYHAENIKYKLKKKTDRKTTAGFVKKVYADYAAAFTKYKNNPSDAAVKTEYIHMLKVYNSVKRYSLLQITRNDQYDPEIFIFNDALAMTDDEKQASVLMREEVQTQITRATKSNLIDGHYVEILKNGCTAFPRRLELIEKAQRNILCAALIYHGDEIGKKLADGMAKAVAERQVEAIVTVDALAKQEWNRGFYDTMRDRGIKVELYNKLSPKVWKAIKRLHEKYFIVDGWYGITGGMNVGDEYANGGVTADGWRDTDVYVEGPVVKLMERNYMMNYEKIQKKGVFQKIDAQKEVSAEEMEQVLNINDDPRKDPSKNYDVMVRFISNKPTEKDTRIHDFYISLLENAEKNVYIANPYFAPDEDFVEAMKDAAARGVDVVLLTNGADSQDVPFLGSACKFLYKDLINAGVKIYEWKGTVMHQKVVSADGVTCAIGSYNLDSISRNHNSECILNVLDIKVSEECTQMFLDDLNVGKRVNSVEGQKWYHKASQRIAHSIDYVL